MRCCSAQVPWERPDLSPRGSEAWSPSWQLTTAGNTGPAHLPPRPGQAEIGVTEAELIEADHPPGVLRRLAQGHVGHGRGPSRSSAGTRDDLRPKEEQDMKHRAEAGHGARGPAQWVFTGDVYIERNSTRGRPSHPGWRAGWRPLHPRARATAWHSHALGPDSVHHRGHRPDRRPRRDRSSLPAPARSVCTPPGEEALGTAPPLAASWCTSRACTRAPKTEATGATWLEHVTDEQHKAAAGRQPSQAERSTPMRGASHLRTGRRAPSRTARTRRSPNPADAVIRLGRQPASAGRTCGPGAGTDPGLAQAHPDGPRVRPGVGRGRSAGR